MNEIDRFISGLSISVSDAMKTIDANSNGILFLVDYRKRIVACITDGDIRRHLISGGKLTDKAINVANLNPKIAKSLDEAKSLYHSKNLVSIPIVDKDKTIVAVYNGEIGAAVDKPSLNVPIIINAGGKGTRLDPFTRVLPKPLIPVGDFPIIELIMKEYQSYNCNDFHIIVNYKKELLKAFFSENENCYNITWYDEDKPLGTGGGLSLLRGRMNSTFFFANCDALLTANYGEMLKFHREQHNCITMICAKKYLNIPYGVIEMDDSGTILEMREKPQFSFLTNTGIYIVEPEVIDDIEDGESIGFPEVIERERQKGRKVSAFSVSENDWMDMGQLPELEKMRAKLYGE